MYTHREHVFYEYVSHVWHITRALVRFRFPPAPPGSGGIFFVRVNFNWSYLHYRTIVLFVKLVKLLKTGKYICLPVFQFIIVYFCFLSFTNVLLLYELIPRDQDLVDQYNAFQLYSVYPYSLELTYIGFHSHFYL